MRTPPQFSCNFLPRTCHVFLPILGTFHCFFSRNVCLSHGQWRPLFYHDDIHMEDGYSLLIFQFLDRELLKLVQPISLENWEWVDLRTRARWCNLKISFQFLPNTPSLLPTLNRLIQSRRFKGTNPLSCKRSPLNNQRVLCNSAWASELIQNYHIQTEDYTHSQIRRIAPTAPQYFLVEYGLKPSCFTFYRPFLSSFFVFKATPQLPLNLMSSQVQT